MKLKLWEGDGLAALAEPSRDFSLSAAFSNATGVLVASPLIEAGNESVWIPGEAVASVRSMNRPVVGITAEEEAEILRHPDVVAAVEAALPEIEDWERAL